MLGERPSITSDFVRDQRLADTICLAKIPLLRVRLIGSPAAGRSLAPGLRRGAFARLPFVGGSRRGGPRGPHDRAVPGAAGGRERAPAGCPAGPSGRGTCAAPRSYARRASA